MPKMVPTAKLVSATRRAGIRAGVTEGERTGQRQRTDDAGAIEGVKCHGVALAAHGVLYRGLLRGSGGASTRSL
jgi:hypothetical protein